jgi:hypothetical protein
MTATEVAPTAEMPAAAEVSSAATEMAAAAMPASTAPDDLDSAAIGLHALLKRSLSGRGRTCESNSCE